MIAFLDACAIIYRIEAVEPYLGKLKRALDNLERRHPGTTIAVSRLSTLECRVLPVRNRDDKALRLYDQFFTAPELRIVDLSAEVIDRATIIRAEFRLATPDALQAACALSLPGELAFFTNDPKFRGVDGLKVTLL